LARRLKTSPGLIGPVLPSVLGTPLFRFKPGGAYLETTIVSPAVNTGDQVAGWQDASGNGRHVVQATAANRPTLLPGFLNGYPVLKFNGTTNYLACSPISGISYPFTVVVLCQLLASGANNQVVSFNNGNNAVIYNASGKWSLYGPGVTGPNSTLNKWTVLNAVFSTTPTIHANGGTDTTGSTSTSGTLTPLSIGSAIASAYFNGYIAEIVAFPGALSSGNRAIIDQYFNATYGVY